MSPAVSVVVVGYESRRWLPGLLSSLADGTLAPAEVIVVDNGSTDGTADWLRGAHPEVALLALDTNTGFAHAVNRGVERARSPLVALLNPDVRVAADWLARLSERFADPGVGAAACKMVSLADPQLIYDAGDIVRRDGACLQRGRGRRDDGSFDVAGEAFGACAGAAVYRRDALAAVGGLHEAYFMYLEDADLALSLRAAGWRCAYEPALARHAGEGSSPAPHAAERWVARNTLLLVARWFPARWLGYVAYRRAAALVLAARRRRLRAHLHGLAEGLALMPRARRSRPRPGIPVGRLVPPAPIRGPHAEGHPRRRPPPRRPQ